MKNNTLLIIIILILAAFNIYSNDDFSSLFNDIESVEIEKTPFSFKGGTEFRVEIPYTEIDDFKEPYLRNSFSLEYNIDNIHIISDWDLLIDNEDVSITANESLLELIFNKTTLKTGYIKYNWGDADKINPTNVLNPKNYINSLDITEIPSLSISLEHYIFNNSLEIVYIPLKSKSIFPEGLSNKNTISEERKQYDLGVLGGKISHYGIADISLSYVWDIDDFESIKEITPNQVVIYNQRTHNFGLSTKAIIGKYGLWLEGNYAINNNTKNKIEGVLGFDRSIGSEDQGLINVQTFSSYNFDFNEESLEDELNNKMQNIQSMGTVGVTGNINYSFFNNELTPEVTVIYINNIDELTELIYKAELEYAPLDSLKIILGGEVFTSENTNDLSKIYTSIEYSW